MDALIVLKNNLKNNSWNVHPSFKLDENEAKKIIAEIETLTVSAQIEQIKAAMCDDYCRYPHEINDDEELMEICNRCPLSNL